MKAGSLRHQVVIRSLVETQSTVTGEMVRSWSSSAPVWADIQPLKGQELWASQQRQSQVDTKIILRHSTLVVPSVKGVVAHNSTTYEIESILYPGERTIETHLYCYKVIG